MPSRRVGQRLTTRQAVVIDFIGQGLSNREIAQRMGISEDGVKAHVRRLLAKFQVSNRAALVSAVSNMESVPAATLGRMVAALHASLAGVVGSVASSAVIARAARTAARASPGENWGQLGPSTLSFPDEWESVTGRDAVLRFDAITLTSDRS